MKRSIFILAIFLFNYGKAQVGIGTSTPDVNAVLDLNGGTNKGLLLPRLTDIQMQAMSTASSGMMIYNTSDNFLYIRKSGSWQKVFDNTNSFSLPYTGSLSNSISNAVYLTNNTGNGLAAQSLSNGYGLYGYSTSGRGIFGQTFSGTAGYFNAGGAGYGIVVENGKTGLGITAPAAQLHVLTLSSEVARFDGTNPYINLYHNGIYKAFINNTGTVFQLGTASGSNGAVAIAPQSTTTATFAVNGALGIGVTDPALGMIQTRGTLGAVAALFGDNVTGVAIENSFPGIGLNTYYATGRKSIATGFGGLIGMDPTTGRFYVSTTSASVTGSGTAATLSDRLVIKASGNIGIEGNVNPNAPLSFANTVGNKIALWGDATGVHYGIGIQGSLLQLYTSSSTNDIAFGYGSSSSFTERFRMSHADNIFYARNVRMRFVGEYNTTSHSPAGIEFTNAAGTTLKSFFGMYNDDNIGLYSYAGSGWNSLMANNSTGNVGIGTVPVSSSKLKVDNGSGTSVELAGPLKVSGSYPTAFVVTASLLNLTDAYNPMVNYIPPISDYYRSIIIDNAVCNGDPNAILLVTEVRYVGGTRPVSVVYDANIAKWKISVYPISVEITSCYALANPTGGSCGSSYEPVMPYQPGKIQIGDKFNVLVIKQ